MDIIKTGTALKRGCFGYERRPAILIKNECIIYSDIKPTTVDELLEQFRACETTADTWTIKSFIDGGKYDV